MLDPFIVSINGGGEVDASTLDPACNGFINDKPVLLVNWTGKAERVNIFYYSEQTHPCHREAAWFLRCADDEFVW
ncbi:MAG: hypothetical protein IPK16_19750 [Anaerolineales bacterium]|nr:hypothetical protein [Anaerolineales bacterium]